MTDGPQLPAPEDSPVPPAAQHPALRILLRYGRIVVVTAVAAAVLYAGISQWDSIAATFRSLSWKSLLATTGAIVLAMFAGVKLWQHLLAAMGTEIRFGPAAEVNLVGQLGKYLPGSVWAFALQAQLGKRFRIPRARGLMALLLAAGMSIVTALTLGAIVTPSLADRWGGWMWLFILGPLALIALLPPVLTRIANLGLKAMRRLQLDANLRGKHVALATMWSFIAWALYGLHVWLLTGSLAKQTLWGYIACVAAIALAMSSGFVAFILPSGIGIREAILVATLAPIATVQQALAIALTSRILFTFADLLCAAGGTVASKITLRGVHDHHAVTTALSEREDRTSAD